MQVIRFTITLLGLLLFSSLKSQVVLYNGGTKIYIEQNALLHVGGDYLAEDGPAQAGKLLLNGDFDLTGDWINNSSASGFYPSSYGTVHFTGPNTPQSIAGDQITTFPSLRIAKPGTERALLLKQHSLCVGWLLLEDDVLNTRNFDFTLANGNPDALQRAGGHQPPFTADLAGGYIATSLGQFRRKLYPSENGNPYLFPVGSSARWIPVSIAAQLDSNQYYGVRFVDQPPADLQRLDSSITTINPDWYHQVERTGGSIDPQNIRIYYDAEVTEICDPEEIGIARFANDQWILAGSSRTEIPSSYLAYTEIENFIPDPQGGFPSTSLVLAGLRQADGSPSCAFPPERLLLNLEAEEKAFQLTWETQAPPNISGYLIARSTTGIQFLDIAWVNAISDSLNPTPYEYVDEEVLTAQPYFYRVEEIDLNGGSRFSNIVQGILEGSDAGFASLPFPNPTNEVVNFWLNVSETQSGNIKVYNALGQEVMQENVSLEKGLQKITLPVQSLAVGIYWIGISSPEINHTLKFRVR